MESDEGTQYAMKVVSHENEELSKAQSILKQEFSTMQLYSNCKHFLSAHELNTEATWTKKETG